MTYGVIDYGQYESGPGAFEELRQREFNECLQELYRRLYPTSRIDGLAAQPWKPTPRQRLRTWAWQVRSWLGRPVHWLAGKINPGGCGCDDHECC